MIALKEIEIRQEIERDYVRGQSTPTITARAPMATVRLELLADGDELEALLAWLRGVQRGEQKARPALPETAKALPAAAVEAEFVDP